MDKFLKKLQGLIKESKDKGHIIIRIEDLEKEFPELLENDMDFLYPLCKTTKDKIRVYIANHFITDTVVKTDVRSIVHAMEEGVRLGKEVDGEYLESIKSEIKRLHDAVKKKKEEYERYEIWGEVPELRGKLKAYEELYSFISNIKK